MVEEHWKMKTRKETLFNFYKVVALLSFLYDNESQTIKERYVNKNNQ
jgi:hypothetical protein